MSQPQTFEEWRERQLPQSDRDIERWLDDCWTSAHAAGVASEQAASRDCEGKLSDAKADIERVRVHWTEVVNSLGAQIAEAKAEVERLKGIILEWWSDPDNPPTEAARIAAAYRYQE